ncbi:MAG TPA: M48 family metallopeptidase [Pirellulales bacterium]
MSDDASSREELQAAILGAFRGTIEPRKTTWRYRSAVLLAALATLPVVAIYLVALAAAAAMVWYPPDHSIIAWAIRIVGVGLGLVLARPILRWFAPSPPVVVATRRDEPLLFAFVDRVCETVGSPRPTEIVFDVDANAGVSLRRGLFSLPWNDLKLKIGLPLVRGMSLKQLAGILAHEFGHLSQTTGLRLATFATVVNNWFAHLLDEPATRLVRHRRALPQLLHQLVNGVLSVARAVGWMELARYHFRTLGVLSETATSNLSREMEHDADRSSARLIGSEAAAEALDRTLFLSAAEHTALNDLDFNFRERRLPDDLPEWIVSRLDWLTPNLLHAIVMRYEVERADAMATHPGRAARVAEWKTQAVAGVFDYEGPASLLFRDLPSLSRRATRELYSYLFGSQLDLLRIDSTAEALRRRQEIYDQAEARGRFWPVPSLLSRPFPLAGDKGTPLAPHADFAAVLATSRATAEREALEYRAALSKYAAAERRLEALRLPEAAASARVPFASRDFGLTSATSAGVRDAQAIAVKEQVDQIAAMATFEQASSQRLFAAIALISVADGSASTVSEHAEDDP